ncbi:hypothetical protein N7532_003926 [Penicillium argentinense]|uniref:Amine oxidase domain-containing protein n=1 Tax=Penicillium argentinense TaxID=1131581 RepID=A0A9W9KFM9_9EURO|nr:uncharacterized protein N7532_003926 [Penicillium argentinense]KAJ5103397.1 hypothetical protein N7532_003926 [Penicillium argentinense]
MAAKAKPRVGIVGAGIAGLRCADILIQNGARVTILEARGRIGGRVHQSEIAGHLVDLGPNWIHGTEENPIMDIADATKTIARDPEGRNISISCDGQLVDEQLTTKAAEFIWTTIEKAFEYSNHHGDSIPVERSLFDFIQEHVQKTNFSDKEKKLCLDSCKLWGAYVGDPIERQSLKFFRLEECIDGNNYFVASTYKRILEHVAKTALAQADIRFKQHVIKIEAPQIDGKHQVKVTTASGDIHDFDELVVTCPLGWLKRNTEAFHPRLPDRLLEAIKSISYGRLEKVYITFPEAFWNTDSNDTAHNKQPSANPVFAQFLEPTYTSHPKDIQWNQECLSLASLPTPCAHPTLLFYTYGPCATNIVEQIADLVEGSEKYNQVLTTILEPFYSKLPGYNPTSTSCKPTSILATRWQKDPYAGNGSYCNFQVDLTTGDKDIEALRSGVGLGPERGIWFAGEHTAPFVALGTTTGAYWSGERAAVQVCGKVGLGRIGVGVARDDSLPSASAGGK